MTLNWYIFLLGELPQLGDKRLVVRFLLMSFRANEGLMVLFVISEFIRDKIHKIHQHSGPQWVLGLEVTHRATLTY